MTRRTAEELRGRKSDSPNLVRGPLGSHAEHRSCNRVLVGGSWGEERRGVPVKRQGGEKGRSVGEGRGGCSAPF